MVGIPKTLSTRADWFNAVEYAKTTGEGKAELRTRLLWLKEHSKILVLKESSREKNGDELTPDDFEAVDDPNAEKIRIGITDAEIDGLTGGLT